MNASEGLLRIAKVVTWIGKGGALIALLFGLGLLVAAERITGDIIGIFAAFIVGGAFWYGCCAAAAWIIEGFAQPRKQ